MENGIFISYSHTDKEKVDSIIPVLQDVTDMPVWYDNSLRYGDKFFSIIAEQILQNDYFIFVVSENSIQSDWCMHELEFAMSEKKKILALFIENVTLPPAVRLIISNTHYIQPVTFSDDELREMFKNSIIENHLETENDSQNKNDSDISGFPEAKYFVTENNKAKIKKCLEYEKKGLFTKCFTPENSLLLGIAYETGIYTDTDLKKAEFYYTIGMYKNNKYV